MTSSPSVLSGASTLLTRRLDRVARARSGEVAVIDGPRRTTYAQLLGRADALAAELIARGIGPGDLVGVALPRSADLVIAVTGVLRSGAAYVPIDVLHPQARREAMLADAAPRVVVAEDAAAAGVPRGIDVLTLPTHMAPLLENPPLPAPGDPAYVIYTSGSTGRPKGVLVTHHNVARLFTTTEPLFRFGADETWTLFHSIAFDFSVWEMWGALLHGGRLVVVPSATARAADAFHALVVREGVTVLNQTPSAFRAFDAADAASGRPGNALRHVVFGGEALDPRTLAGWFDAHGDTAPVLVNMYGITETTVHTTYRRMRAADARGGGRSLIGAPLPDLRIDLLGPDGQPVPDGEIGEIHVGGSGVARGYLRRPELTAERFAPDPTGDADARRYRSGDLARRTADGDVEYLGRGDAQVKLRGFRIELGEVEAALREVAGVREAVVALRQDAAAGARLVAYVVLQRDASLDPHALRAHAAGRLPEYMVPAAYVRIEQVPRTVNDKVDRAALPEPTAADLPRAPGHDAPGTATEQTIADIWRELLGIESPRRDDDFVNLGGHSLLATRVAARCAERLGAAITGLDVLEVRTLAALAARVDAAPRAEPSVAQGPPPTSSPVTPGQAGVLLQQQLAGPTPILNEPIVLELRGAIDTPRLVAELKATLDAHPALRSRFVERDGVWIQETTTGASVPVEVVNAPGGIQGDVRAALATAAAREFDLARGPLARALVACTAADACTVMIVAHHLVIDEWSVHLLLAELGARLGGRTPSGAADPGPFSHATRRAAARERAADGDRAHWRSELEGATLEVDCARPVAPPDAADDPNAGEIAEVAIDGGVTDSLRASLRTSGATEFEAGLAAFAAALEHEAHRPDVVVLATLADRDRPGVAGVVGYLLDVLPVRVRLEGDPTVKEVLARTRSAVAGTAAHRVLTPGEAVATAGLALETTTQGIGAVFYTRQEEVAARLVVPGVSVVQRTLHLGLAKFDLSLYLISGPERLTIRVEYRSRSVDRALAWRLAGRVARLLGVVATAPETRLSALDLLDPAERSAVHRQSWGPSGAPAPWPIVPVRVGEIARQQPGSPAVIEDGRSVSYAELLAAADDLAQRLRALGVGPNDVVPVLGRRSAAMVASWLGALRAGAAYAPVEADQPPSRRAAMIEDCRPRAVVADPAFRDGIPSGLPVLDLADPWAARAAGGPAAGAEPLPPRLGPDDLAYVVFTSGSTGRPKGVEIGQAALAHIVVWHRKQLGLTTADRVPLLSGIGFDATVLETWATLCAGGTLAIPQEETRLAPPRLRDWIVERGITTAFAPTVLAEVLLALPWPATTRLRMLQTGGEVLRSRPPAGLPFALVNLYGPAEVAVWVTHARVTPDGAGLPPIGVPLDDIGTHVVDHRGRLCGAQTLGELWLAGPQTGCGYRGLPERTATSFPQVEIEPGRPERVYRTGDLVRRAPDGVIHFVGRRDTQVKLRGVRIEIGEIEAVLLTHPGVKSCAVALRGTPSEPYLAGYVEPADPQHPPGETSLSDHVAARVPRAMVPTRWSVVAALARTPNGKIDRKVLPEIAAAGAAGAGEPPRTDTERKVARVFADVLGVPVTTRDADLFRLGGHSMSAVRVVTQISREITPVPVRALLEAPTVRGLAAVLDKCLGAAAAPSSAVVRIRDGDGVPLFCLPGIGGHVIQYRLLAERLRSTRPILGLQLFELGLAPDTLESIDATAAALVREIRKTRSHGPYALTGYSYGGILALEIARQLIDAGEAVSLVALLDAYAPGTAAIEPWFVKLRKHLTNIKGASVGGLFDYLGRRIRRRVRRLLFHARQLGGQGGRTPAALEQHMEETGVRCWRALQRYVARPFPGRVTVFRASRVEWMRVDDPTGTCGWGPLCQGVDVVETGCEHLDFFTEPHISEIARRLDAALAGESLRAPAVSSVPPRCAVRP